MVLHQGQTKVVGRLAPPVLINSGGETEDESTGLEINRRVMVLEAAHDDKLLLAISVTLCGHARARLDAFSILQHPPVLGSFGNLRGGHHRRGDCLLYFPSTLHWRKVGKVGRTTLTHREFEKSSSARVCMANWVQST